MVEELEEGQSDDGYYHVIALVFNIADQANDNLGTLHCGRRWPQLPCHMRGAFSFALLVPPMFETYRTSLEGVPGSLNARPAIRLGFLACLFTPPPPPTSRLLLLLALPWLEAFDRAVLQSEIGGGAENRDDQEA